MEARPWHEYIRKFPTGNSRMYSCHGLMEATWDGVAHWDETGESSVFEMSVAEEEGIQVRELK